jgi:hypothetical protein
MIICRRGVKFLFCRRGGKFLLGRWPWYVDCWPTLHVLGCSWMSGETDLSSSFPDGACCRQGGKFLFCRHCGKFLLGRWPWYVDCWPMLHVLGCSWIPGETKLSFSFLDGACCRRGGRFIFRPKSRPLGRSHWFANCWQLLLSPASLLPVWSILLFCFRSCNIFFISSLLLVVSDCKCLRMYNVCDSFHSHGMYLNGMYGNKFE